MAVLQTGQTFTSGDQVTADKLMDIANDARFITTANETADGSTIEVDATGGYLKVPSNGIGSNELSSDASVDANRAVDTNHIKDDAVTYDKIQDVAANSVIGNTTASIATPTNVAILDEDDMASDSATSLATQQSIKAYVDSQAGVLSVSNWTQGTITSGTEVQAPDNDKNFAGVYVRSNTRDWPSTAYVYYYTDATTQEETFYMRGAGDSPGSVFTSSFLLVPLYTNTSGNKVMKLSWSAMAVVSGRYWI